MGIGSQRLERKEVHLRVASVAIVIMLMFAAAHSTAAAITIYGAGATFPAPFISAVISNFTSTYPGYQVNYQAVGSGFGINHLISKDQDFVASDAPLNPAQQSRAPNALHIPETIGSVTLSYNLPGISSGLNLTGSIIADIYRGVITKWNDTAIQNLNRGFLLPAQPIVPVHRSDGSGTTFVFTSFLSLESSAWATPPGPGNGTSVSWPVGPGFQGNANVAQAVQSNPYYIGYVELNYALTQHLTFASLKNPRGEYVAPGLSSTQAAVAAGAGSLPMGNQSWYHVSLLDENAPGAYPIASFSYFMIYKELNVVSGMTADLANLVVAYLWFHVHQGQNLATGLSYVSLSPAVVAIDETTLNSVTFNGLPVSNTLTPVTSSSSGILQIALVAVAVILFLGVLIIFIHRRRAT